MTTIDGSRVLRPRRRLADSLPGYRRLAGLPNADKVGGTLLLLVVALAGHSAHEVA